jgi:hypothetical protein
MDDSRTAELRRRRRDFIRSQHPDRGGDPDEFVTGLRAFAGPEDDLGPLPVVTVVRRPGWLLRGTLALGRRFRAGPPRPRVR